MHKGSGLISFKIGKIEMQKTSAGSQKCRSNFAHCANFAHVQKFAHARIFLLARSCPASHFRPKTTPFCIFFNFTLDVITIDMGILVFHFFVRLYIAILCTVEKDGGGTGQGIEKNTVLCFWILSRLSFPLIFSYFLGNQTLP